jgi:hypothetical protein
MLFFSRELHIFTAQYTKLLKTLYASHICICVEDHFARRNGLDSISEFQCYLDIPSCCTRPKGICVVHLLLLNSVVIVKVEGNPGQLLGLCNLWHAGDDMHSDTAVGFKELIYFLYIHS